MAYWGSRPEESDFAFGAVGTYVCLLKDRMMKDAATVAAKSYPEQSIVVSLKCLRVLAEEFPKNVRLHFGRKDFEESKVAFESWYEAVKAKLPAKYADAIRAQAIAEFQLFEERVLKTCSKDRGQ